MTALRKTTCSYGGKEKRGTRKIPRIFSLFWSKQKPGGGDWSFGCFLEPRIHAHAFEATQRVNEDIRLMCFYRAVFYILDLRIASFMIDAGKTRVLMKGLVI